MSKNQKNIERYKGKVKQLFQNHTIQKIITINVLGQNLHVSLHVHIDRQKERERELVQEPF